MTAHKGRVGSQQIHIEIIEVELAHFFALSLIALPVMIERGLPALGRIGAGEEGQIRRAPVSLHEAFQIVGIPGVHLRLQQMADRQFLGIGGTDLLRTCK